MMQDGIQVDPNYQIEVMQRKLAAAAVREAMLEAAIQQLLAGEDAMSVKIAELERQIPNHAPMQSDEG
jgi:hypothetical protein